MQASSDREVDGLKSQIAIMEAAVADAEERVNSAQRRARADARAAIAKSKASACETLEVHPHFFAHLVLLCDVCKMRHDAPTRATDGHAPKHVLFAIARRPAPPEPSPLCRRRRRSATQNVPSYSQLLHPCARRSLSYAASISACRLSLQLSEASGVLQKVLRAMPPLCSARWRRLVSTLQLRRVSCRRR